VPTYRVPVVSTYPAGGGPGVNIWHLRTAGVPLEGETEIANAMGALRTFYNAIGGLVPPSTSYAFPTELVEVNDAELVPAPSVASVVGRASTDAYLPIASAMVVSWRTSSATRSGRGRTFIGPLHPSTGEANGTPTEGARETLADAADALVAAGAGSTGSGGGWSFGVYSRSQGLIRDFASASVANQYAVLRSRRD
jgi:hypothetical protein